MAVRELMLPAVAALRSRLHEPACAGRFAGAGAIGQFFSTSADGRGSWYDAGIHERRPTSTLEQRIERHQVWLESAGSDGEQLDLRAAGLAESDWSDVNFSEIDLREARLEGARLIHADLYGSLLAGAQLDRASPARGSRARASRARPACSRRSSNGSISERTSRQQLELRGLAVVLTGLARPSIRARRP
jgi:hypothetical protein